MSMSVLLVEDDRLLLHTIKVGLEKAGIEVVAVGDGEAALKKLGEREFGLVVLDLVMPHMDGFEFLKQLRDNPEIKHPDVLVASNLGMEDEIKRAKDLGAVDFVVKANIEISDLVAKIKMMLGE